MVGWVARSTSEACPLGDNPTNIPTPQRCWVVSFGKALPTFFNPTYQKRFVRQSGINTNPQMSKYRKVNRMVDVSPRLFGLIPFTMIYPIAGFMFVSYVIYSACGDWIPAAATFATCVTSYAILTAKGSHKYLSRLIQSPPRWIRLPLPFRSYLQYLHDLDNIQKNPKANGSKRR